MKEKHSAKFLRQKKMMLILPVLIIPFLTMAFWSLGGGAGSDSNKQEIIGLNLQLPDAKLKNEENEDKLTFYKNADTDSLKRQELLRSDPFYKDSILNRADVVIPQGDDYYASTVPPRSLNMSPYNVSTDRNEQRVYQKIQELNRQINSSNISDNNLSNSATTEHHVNDGKFANDVDRLEGMMQTMHETNDTDTEMQELDGTLEKILDIQNPERVKERIRGQSLKNKEQVYIIEKNQKVNRIGLLDTSRNSAPSSNQFYSVTSIDSTQVQNALEAVVHQTQTLVNGSVVKLRLVSDFYINGRLVSKGSFVYGIAQLDNERLEIVINSIRSNKSLFNVKLEVFDQDGLQGIYIPGAISRDVAKQSADDGLQLMEMTSLDPSLKAQVAATGISAAKNLLSKKVKLIKVTVKAGYKVLLKDKNLQQ